MNSCPLVLKSRCPCRCHHYDKSQHTAPLLILTNGDQNAKIETGIQSIGIQLFELRHDIGFSCLIWNLEVFLKHKKQAKQRQTLQHTHTHTKRCGASGRSGIYSRMFCSFRNMGSAPGESGRSYAVHQGNGCQLFLLFRKEKRKTTLHQYWMKAKVSSESWRTWDFVLANHFCVYSTDINSC